MQDVYIPGADLTETTEVSIFIRRNPKAPRLDFGARVAEFLGEVR